jgi:hypothetical protein
MSRAWHGTELIGCRLCLGCRSTPLGGTAREAGGLLRYDGRHNPLVARSIKDSANLAWNIIVYVSSIIVVIYQVFKYYGYHILLVQKFL